MRPIIALFCIAISALPAFAQQTTIAGTDGKNALGYLTCGGIAGVSTGQCAFEVLRQGGPDTTLRVLLPQGNVRYIYFKDGQPNATDSTSRMSVEKRGDMMVIFIDPSEVYEVPVSVISGK